MTSTLNHPAMVLRQVELPEQRPPSHPRAFNVDHTTIAEAYAYHEVLVQNLADAVSNDKKRSDMAEDLDASDSDVSEHSDAVGNGDDCDADSQVGRGIHGPVPYVKAGFNHRLLANPWQRSPDHCGNSGFRAGLWGVDPRLVRDLTRSDLDMGFLSQLAQLCIQAQLRPCEHEPCALHRTAMARTAPRCDWAPFSEWALVAMSCQAGMGDEDKISQAHTHLARAISGCCMILKNCLDRARLKSRFVPFLDGHWDEASRVDLAQVTNVIYWMARAQSHIGIGPKRFGRWDHHLLPSDVTMPSIETAALAIEDMGLCENRLWSLVNVSDRKQSDLPDIILALGPYKQSLGHSGHDFCTPSKCQWAQMNTTSVTQLHKCGKGPGTVQQKVEPGAEARAAADCHQKGFPVELLETALELGQSTAWLCDAAKLTQPDDPYIAISHVWSDGTGVGVKQAGTVNACLFEFFTLVARQLGCTGVWWDALSIPYEPKARSKALNMMHANYANAAYTVVHDNYLLNFAWRDDGSPCLALVLSTWFTRGWTALELSMSRKVRVLFKDPTREDGVPVIKDLDDDILARGPAGASRAHWLATTLIRRLRKPIDNIGDLLAILSPRSTSWTRDRTIIAALLAGLPDCDFTVGESLITSQILKYVGRIPYACLLHGKPTMRTRGGFSWCAATLDDMPVDIASDLDGGRLNHTSHNMLEIDETGAVEGRWRCRPLRATDPKNLKQYGNDLAVAVKVNVALRHWERCLLLRHPMDRLRSEASVALLVMPISVVPSGPILKCRYIGAVVEDRPYWPERCFWTIRLGGTDDGKEPMLNDTTEMLMQDPLRFARTVVVGEHQPDEDDVDDDKSVRGDDEAVESATRLTARRKATAASMTTGQGRVKSPKWLGSLELVKYHPPQPQVPQTISAFPKEIPRPPQMTTEHLITALKAKNEGAMRYLVRNGIDLGEGLTKSHLEKLVGKEEALSRLKILGDIYVDSGKPIHGLNMYRHVIDSYKELEHHHGSMPAPLHFSYTKYSLGSLHMRLQKGQWQRGGFASKGRGGSNQHLDDGKRCFEKVLEMCGSRNKRGGSHADGGTRSDAPGTGDTPDKDEAAEAAAKAREKKETTALANHIKTEQRWYQLELNAIAELILLHVSQFELRDATQTYQRALRRFGWTSGDQVEAFSGPWFSRHGDRRAAYERTGAVYQRALKRFSTMFHGAHVLTAITSLSLGVNYMLRAKFPKAEEQLTSAAEGFAKYFGRPSSSSSSAAAAAAEDDPRGLDEGNMQHAITCLTSYHLGILFTQQEKFDQAEEQLGRARAIASRLENEGVRDATVMKLLSMCALGDSKLLRPRVSFEDVDTLFEEVSRSADSHLQHKTVDRGRLIFRAQFGQAKVLHLGRDEPQKAVALCEAIIGIAGSRSSVGTFGNPDLDICEARVFVGGTYRALGQLDAAEQRVMQALEGFKQLSGERSLPYLQATRQLGVIYAMNGKRNKAESEFRKAYETLMETMGAFYIPTLETSLQLGRLYLEKRELDRAEEACKRAYEGFGKFLGPRNRLTADAGQALGTVYFEKGMLSKAQSLYSEAFSVFDPIAMEFIISRKDAPKGRKSGRVEARPVVTDMATLRCAMGLAQVSAVFRDWENKSKAGYLFRLAVRGFESAGQAESLSGLEAKLNLGRFYQEQRKFKPAKTSIEEARAGFRQLSAAKVNGIMGNRNSLDAEVKCAEADLAFGQLILGKKQNRRDHARSRIDDEDVDLGGSNDEENDIDGFALIKSSCKRLEELLGKVAPLTLEASTTLGELYLQYANHADSGQGEEILTSVLNSYTYDTNMPPGHPKKLRVMEILVDLYSRQGEIDKMDVMKTRLWEELVASYGVDFAAMVMHMTNLSRPAGDGDDTEEDGASHSSNADSESQSSNASNFDSDDEGTREGWVPSHDDKSDARDQGSRVEQLNPRLSPDTTSTATLLSGADTAASGNVFSCTASLPVSRPPRSVAGAEPMEVNGGGSPEKDSVKAEEIYGTSPKCLICRAAPYATQAALGPQSFCFLDN
ncbi:hypothetical protein F5144DRAFT_544516 [Chaetomium tenue]|uniref:Uncharacterized protein n=1 Tax=Chaetomium tenue TaxID=1854479 RepID=A0ACB7PED9_9PEZI|nr:hypothetical protein F5144DRAFT_544516 [Chaetomium globosum]